MPDASHAHHDRDAAARIAATTRARFGLPAGAHVDVHEHASDVPGAPSRETLVSFWTGPERRHDFTVFKPAAEVAEDDLPPAFMKAALVADDDRPCC